MFTLLIALSAGIAVGVLIKIPVKLLKLLGAFQQYVVYLLIALLGASIGTNRQLVAHLPSVGAKALLIAVLAVVGSVLCCMLFAKLLGVSDKGTPHE